MYKSRKKYRSIIFLISLFYVNFFSFSPYFHHHHLEREKSQEKSEIFHSHIFGDFNNNPYSEESDHHSEDKDHHSHLSQQNYVYRIKLSIDTQTSLNIDFTSTFENSVIDREISAITTPTIDGFAKPRWDKYVHSATNVSPPLV